MATDKFSSIEKAIQILNLLSEPPYKYKIPEICNKTGFNRTTVYRTLCTLEDNYMVVRDAETDKYQIGPDMYRMGSIYHNNYNYDNKVNDLLNELSDITKESVGLAVKDMDKIVSLFEIEVNQPMKLNDVPGKYFTVNKGVYGKCIMAFQSDDYIEKYLEDKTFEKTLPNTLTTKEELMAEYEKIRKDGYATSIDEVIIDMVSIGVPLYDSRNNVKACVAIAFWKTDNYLERINEYKNLLMSYQRKIERYLP